MGHMAWAAKRRKGRSQAGPKGHQLEVGARRAPKLLVKHPTIITAVLSPLKCSSSRAEQCQGQCFGRRHQTDRSMPVQYLLSASSSLFSSSSSSSPGPGPARQNTQSLSLSTTQSHHIHHHLILLHHGNQHYPHIYTDFISSKRSFIQDDALPWTQRPLFQLRYWAFMPVYIDFLWIECRLMLAKSDWCLLMMNETDWFWSILIDAYGANWVFAKNICLLTLKLVSDKANEFWGNQTQPEYKAGRDCSARKHIFQHLKLGVFSNTNNQWNMFFFLNQNFCFAHGHEVNHLAKESATFTDYQTFTEFLLKLDTMTLWQFTDQLVKHLTKKSLHCRCFFTG